MSCVVDYSFESHAYPAFKCLKPLYRGCLGQWDPARNTDTEGVVTNDPFEQQGSLLMLKLPCSRRDSKHPPSTDRGTGRKTKKSLLEGATASREAISVDNCSDEDHQPPLRLPVFLS
jgi:hypothetical protein